MLLWGWRAGCSWWAQRCPARSPGWPQIGGCASHLAPSVDVEISHLVPFLGARCAHRLVPDIAPFPGAVSSSKCSCFFFFFFYSFYHRLLLMWETRARLCFVFRDRCRLGGLQTLVGFMYFWMLMFYKSVWLFVFYLKCSEGLMVLWDQVDWGRELLAS